MIDFKLREAIFPVTLLAFEAVGVRYWNVIFNGSTRWVLLAALFFVVVWRGQLFWVFRTGIGYLLGAYLFWCVCTVAWSEVPVLSLLKSLALIVSVPAIAGAGQAWGFYSARDATFGFLLPVVALALFAGLFDRGAAIDNGGVEIYQGLSGNPNYLGAIIAMSFPWAVWQAYRCEHVALKYIIYLSIIGVLLVCLWLSGSRASMLCVLSMFIVFLITLNSEKRVMALGILGLVCIGVAIAAPAVRTSLYERIVLKGTMDNQGDILFSRRDVWSESYELAKQGGVVGGGYGVSIGDSNFAIGVTAIGYGREKGNSQLGIWEETGLVGLALYGLLIFRIILDLGMSLAKIGDRQSKVELGLLFGAILGITIQSIFEAWWDAPGAPEFAFFWATVGVAYGVVRRASFNQQQVRRVPYQSTRTRAVPSFALDRDS